VEGESRGTLRQKLLPPPDALLHPPTAQVCNVSTIPQTHTYLHSSPLQLSSPHPTPLQLSILTAVTEISCSYISNYQCSLESLVKTSSSTLLHHHTPPSFTGCASNHHHPLHSTTEAPLVASTSPLHSKSSFPLSNL